MQVKVDECLSADEWLTMVANTATLTKLLDHKRSTELTIGRHKVVAMASNLTRFMTICSHAAHASVWQKRVKLTAELGNGGLCVSVPLEATEGDRNMVFFPLA